MLKKCPGKLIEECYELWFFYNGLSDENKNIVNVSAGGTVTEKTYEEVKQLFHRIAKNHSLAPAEKGGRIVGKKRAVLELDETSGIAV